MANWSNPTLTSTYTNFVTEVKGRDDDLARGLDPATTTTSNLPTNAIRWNSSTNLWEKFNGTSWAALSTGYAISITGNAGTATTLQTARTINGVSFNGSANITLPTVNTSGDQTVDGIKTFNAQIVASGGVSGNVTGTASNVTGTVAVGNGGTGATTAAAARVNLAVETGATGSTRLAAGTTAQRDASPSAGFIRFNTSLTRFEGWNGSAWSAVGGGATGGGTDDVFIENGQTVTTNYTLSTNKNAVSAGPITISSGITVTVPAGSNWAIV